MGTIHLYWILTGPSLAVQNLLVLQYVSVHMSTVKVLRKFIKIRTVFAIENEACCRNTVVFASCLLM
jgi:hypothetical protein